MVLKREHSRPREHTGSAKALRLEVSSGKGEAAIVAGGRGRAGGDEAVEETVVLGFMGSGEDLGFCSE